VAELFVRTLKEQLLWVQAFDTVVELRLALLEFKERSIQPALAAAAAWLPDPGRGVGAVLTDQGGGVNFELNVVQGF